MAEEAVQEVLHAKGERDRAHRCLGMGVFQKWAIAKSMLSCPNSLSWLAACSALMTGPVLEPDQDIVMIIWPRSSAC